MAEDPKRSLATSDSSAISPPRSILEAIREFDTALVATAIGHLDSTPAHELYMSCEIRSATPTLGPIAGVAVTCEIDSSTPVTAGAEEMQAFWDQVDYIAQLGLPAIWVAKAVGSRPAHECVLGDGMAKTLYAAGCLGAVTDGGIRDVRGLLSTPFSAHCRGTVVHHGPLRIRAAGRPVEIGGIRIQPGDVLHCDCEGVIRIPAACLETLPAKASQLRRFEHDAHCVLRSTDLAASEKRERITRLRREHGLSPP